MCIWDRLPYDVQRLVRTFTPHPVSLLVKEAHALWSDLQEARKMWYDDEESRVKFAQRLRDKQVKSVLLYTSDAADELTPVHSRCCGFYYKKKIMKLIVQLIFRSVPY